MATDRSDKLHFEWRASTEKFDYFVLGVIFALCAFIGQAYKPRGSLSIPDALEITSLLILVLAAISGFKRLEQTILVSAVNSQRLHALEAKGGMVDKMQNGLSLINAATGDFYSPEQAVARVEKLNKKIKLLEGPLEKHKQLALVYYKRRNLAALIGFLLLIAARISSVYV